MRACKQQALKVLFLLILLNIVGISAVIAVKSASIVICAETGAVHHQANADEITHPASLTKMMTLYLTFKALREKRLSFDQKLPVSKHASRQAPTKLGLKPGTTITVQHAILALITKSANDAAVVLAEALGRGSENHFAQMMTKQARGLGMAMTIFKNASGLPNKHQITTARDMATLSRALYKDFPKYFKFFKQQEFVYKGQVHPNHNHLLGKVKGVDGIKTGFTNASGFNLAASMIRDNRRIIAVVMGGKSIKDRDKKMVHLLETTHATLEGTTTPQQLEEYASIGDLIYALSPSEARAESIQIENSNLKNAVFLSNSGQLKTIKADNKSLDDIIKVIENENRDHKTIKKKGVSKKTPSKKAKEKKVTRKAKTSKNKIKTKKTYKIAKITKK